MANNGYKCGVRTCSGPRAIPPAHSVIFNRDPRSARSALLPLVPHDSCI